MGKANAAQHAQRGVAPEQYLTPRLWGVADSAPYLHDGRAPSFDYAIAGHDGEGAAARAAFEALPLADRGPLRVYLMSLRRASRVDRALIAALLARRSTYRSSTPTPAAPSTGWRSEPISNAGRPRPSGSGARRMCHPNQSSASSPTSSLSTSPVFAGAELDATDLVVRPATMPRRADRDVVDAVAVEIAGGDDHAAELLAGLASRPVPQLLSRARRVDEDLARERARLLLFRGGRRHGEVALAVAVEVGDRGERRRRTRRGDPCPSGTRAPCRSPTRGSRRRRPACRRHSPPSVRRRRGRRGRRRRDRRGGRRTSRRTRPLRSA